MWPPAAMGDRVQGVGVSPGIVLGRAHVLDLEGATERPHEKIPDEGDAIARAAALGAKQLEAIAQKLRDAGRESEAAIMDAQVLMVQDPALLEAAHERVEAGESAATAVQHAGDGFKDMLAAIGDDYLAARAADVQDVASRIIRNLSGGPGSVTLREPSILVAHDLSPSETATLDRSLVLGIATDAGSPTSHTAILAQALRIPAAVGLGDISRRVEEGLPLILDGEHGVVILNPSPQEERQYLAGARKLQQRQAQLASIRDQPAQTRDGRRIVLAANIGSPDDLPNALQAGAEGIGLFRTEFLFAGRDRMPSEDEQVEAYRAALEAMSPHLVVVRTLDIGGDKPLPYLPAADEANPFLGERGIRFTLAHPDIFRTQLRALLRASRYGRLGIMFPMVGEAGQIEQANAILEQVRTEVAGQAEVGIMIEVPSAALTADSLAKSVSFFSVGTNDLIQYSLAVDRVNDRVAHLYRPLHPAIVRLLSMTVQAAHQHGKWAGVCGEMAGDPDAIPLLVGLGFDELSMTSGRVPAAKERIRSLNQKVCSDLARRALECDTEVQVIELIHHSPVAVDKAT